LIQIKAVFGPMRERRRTDQQGSGTPPGQDPRPCRKDKIFPRRSTGISASAVCATILPPRLPGRLPGRQHIDPLEIPDLLPYVMLVDVIRAAGQPLRYQIRLAGTQVVAIQGADATGKFVEEVLDKGPEIVARYEDILTMRQPQYRCGQVATQGRNHVTYQRMAFPLATDGETVDMLMFVFAMEAPGEPGVPPGG